MVSWDPVQIMHSDPFITPDYKKAETSWFQQQKLMCARNGTMYNIVAINMSRVAATLSLYAFQRSILPEIEIAGQVNILKDPHISRKGTENMQPNLIITS